MAHQTVIQLVDDLDGITTDGIDTVVFALDGVSYEIDLCAENADSLRVRLSEFVASARRTGGRKRRSPATQPAGSLLSKEQNREIRDWARTNGYDVAERGRIAADVVAAFDAAAAAPAKPKVRRRKNP